MDNTVNQPDPPKPPPKSTDIKPRDPKWDVWDQDLWRRLWKK